MKITELKIKKGNPRLIKDDKFLKLVKSIEEFPKMLELRPIIYDPVTMEILGGNMRFKALQQLKYKDIPNNWLKSASELTEEEKKRFIITDNVGFGEWYWEILQNEWDKKELEAWGLDLPKWSDGLDVNNMTDDDVDIEDEFDPIGVSKGLTRIVIIHDNIQNAKDWIKENIPTLDYKKKGNDENIILQVNLSSNYGI